MRPENIIIKFQEINYRIKNRYLLSNLNLSIGQGEALILLGRKGIQFGDFRR